VQRGITTSSRPEEASPRPAVVERGTNSRRTRLPATLRLGAVHLTVPDLGRSVAFYQNVIGLRLHRSEDSVAAMGAGGEDLVVLHEEAGARHASRHAGLYHYALLFPSREELAHAALRLAVTKTPIQGAPGPRRQDEGHGDLRI
jgi:catechol-2,3-dioxygenase